MNCQAFLVSLSCSACSPAFLVSLRIRLFICFFSTFSSSQLCFSLERFTSLTKDSLLSISCLMSSVIQRERAFLHGYDLRGATLSMILVIEQYQSHRISSIEHVVKSLSWIIATVFRTVSKSTFLKDRFVTGSSMCLPLKL